MTTKVKSSVLDDTSVNTGTYGGASNIPVFTVDQQGRLTSAANATPSIATTQLTGSVNAKQVANNQTYGINVTGSSGYSTSATRLLRSDAAADAYNLQSHWDGTYWYLKGYNDSTYHANVRVGYSDTAGSAPASDVYSWAKATTKPSYSASEVGLGNVNNTSDANKSVNFATYSGLAGVATSANNGGVTSVSAGSGISVSSSTGGVTVTNSGVTGITAGTGISVSGSGTITITATGGSSVSTITNLTSQTLASSGTATVLNFTGIPAWAKRIKVMYYALGTVGSSPIIIRTLSGGGTTALTSGYICNSTWTGSPTILGGESFAHQRFSTGFGYAWGQYYYLTGTTTFDRLNDNYWTCSGSVTQSDKTLTYVDGISTTSGGVLQVVALSGIQITTVAGSSRFWNGSVNVSYE